MFITSKNKYLSNDMKIFGTCSIPLTTDIHIFKKIKDHSYNLVKMYILHFCVAFLLVPSKCWRHSLASAINIDHYYKVIIVCRIARHLCIRWQHYKLTWHFTEGIPPDQNKSNTEDHNPFLKSCILRIR